MNDPTIHGQVKTHVLQCYRELNNLACPWDASEAAALNRMLKSNPSWSLDDWLRMVSNRFQSDKINGERPRTWLPHISKYARGPLDEFGHVKGKYEPKQSTFARALRRANASPIR